jgi:hypothetical protein
MMPSWREWKKREMQRKEERERQQSHRASLLQTYGLDAGGVRDLDDAQQRYFDLHLPNKRLLATHRLDCNTVL